MSLHSRCPQPQLLVTSKDNDTDATPAELSVSRKKMIDSVIA